MQASFMSPLRLAQATTRKRRPHLPFTAVAAALVAAGCQSSAQASSSSSPGEASLQPAVQTKASQSAMTPQQALAELRAGNERFVAGHPRARNLPADVKATAAGQYPFAVI